MRLHAAAPEVGTVASDDAPVSPAGKERLAPAKVAPGGRLLTPAGDRGPYTTSNAPRVRSLYSSTLEPLPLPPDPAKVRLRRTAWTVVVVVLALLLATVGATAYQRMAVDPQLSAYDDDWNDLSSFRTMLETNKRNSVHSIVSSPLILNSLQDLGPGIRYDNSALVIVGVERPYTAEELRAIDNFVFQGGVAVIADDFGYGNQLLKATGLDGVVTFTHIPIKDVRYERNPKFLVLDVPGSALSAGRATALYEVVTNEPASFAIAKGKESQASIIASTSPDAWLDVDDDDERDLTEEVGAFPLIVKLGSEGSSGRGLWWYLSDPGIFLNDMYGRGDNQRFLDAFFRTVSPEGHIFIDESRHGGSAPIDSVPTIALGGALWLLQSPVLTVIFPLAAVITVAVLAVRTKAPTRHRHRDVLNDPRPVHYLQPYLAKHDLERLRRAFLERVRNHYGMGQDEFYQQGALQRLPELVQDDYLLRFVLLDQHRLVALPDSHFSAYAQRVFAWVPPSERAVWGRRDQRRPQGQQSAEGSPPGRRPDSDGSRGHRR